MILGDLELISVCDALFRLDGGAMFGAVAKPLWERRAPADARNRILVAMRPLVVRGHGRTLLIDAGIGEKMDPKNADIYAIQRERTLDDTLRATGIAPGEIDVVLATHLHFDHAGGFTVHDAEGRLRPRFPRAEYVIRRGEWDDAVHPHERNRASYLSENFIPLHEAGVIRFMEADGDVLPGVRAVRTGGHTRHHTIVFMESGGRTAVFAADLIPTTAHVDVPWIMSYDLYPMETLEFKRAFVREAIDREYLVFFEHDPAVAAGIIRERAGRPYVEPVVVATAAVARG
ncbi:MAG TPA: MBL fold metallo-hydrolase [Vicinamibacterales bacterium]|nr:MBL fold metallo-hydrolase [Vicinamibacterales bacterium]